MSESLSTILVIFLSVLTALIIAMGIFAWKIVSDLRSLLRVLKQGAHTLTNDASTFTHKINHLASTAQHRNYKGIMNVAGLAYMIIRWYLKRRR